MAKAKEFKFKSNTNKRTEIVNSMWSWPKNKNKIIEMIDNAVAFDINLMFNKLPKEV